MIKDEVIDRVVELVSDKSGEMRLLVSHWVDIVLADIASRGLLHSLKRGENAYTLVLGQRDYTLLSTTDHITQVFVLAWGSEGRLTKKSDDEFLKLVLDEGTTQGRPKYYNVFSNLIRFHPVPDLASAPVSPSVSEKVTTWGYRDIASIADTADIPELKLKHIPTLIYGAYSFGAKFDSILDAADATMKYERGVNRIIGDSNRDLDRPSQVPYQDL